MSQLRFVVVGSGRSGTRYASMLFGELGIACGHEAVFGWGPEAPGLVGDASAWAVPFLDRFRGVVFHQRRDPLSVVASMVSTGFFADPGAFALHRELIERTLPQSRRRGDPLLQAICFVAEWNLRCERFAALSWRVEDLDASTLARATALVGYPASVERCAAALSAVPRDVNRLEARGIPRQRLRWDDLPSGPEKDELEALAGRYGYPCPSRRRSEEAQQGSGREWISSSSRS